ncbi:ankyrin repeat-containing domain protein [Ilyonectria sp. MPI-CAGE-AT-0026]|nr:ankyrin repeat-containing domain protein [Ilyonectria sp. MPI-CAGE-AT-0026]
MPRPPKKPEDLWGAHREQIRAYYIVENKTLAQTMELMKAEHNFDASCVSRKKEYVNRLHLWQLAKNLKKTDWQLVHQRDSARKRTRVLVNEEDIAPKRLKRARTRYKSEFDKSFQSMLSTTHMLSSQWNWVSPPGSSGMACSPGELSMQRAKTLIAKLLRLREGNNDIDLTRTVLQLVEKLLPRKPRTSSRLISNGPFSLISNEPSSLISNEPSSLISNEPFSLISSEPFFLLIQSCIYLSSNGHLVQKDMDDFLGYILESVSKPLLNQFIDRLQKSGNETVEIFLSRLLLSAVSLEKEDVVSVLLQQGVDPNHGGYDDNERDESDFERFGLDVKRLDPLRMAVLRGNSHITQRLLSCKANPDAFSPGVPVSPLEFAISVSHGNLFITQMLLESGANINAYSSYEIVTISLSGKFPDLKFKLTQRTLLMKAVAVQNIDITRLLLSNGAPVNEVSFISGTALQIAIMNNDMDMVELLLEAGAEVNLVDSLENSARQYVTYCLEYLKKRHRLLQVRGIQDDREYVRIIEEPKWEAFSSPIQIAARQNNLDIARRLLQAGADVNYQPNWGKIWDQITAPPHPTESSSYYQNMRRVSRGRFQTALHEAASQGNLDMTSLLLQHATAPDRINALGATVLQLICGLKQCQTGREDEGNEEGLKARRQLAQVLLRSGSDVNFPPGPLNGRTALQAAAETGDQELIKILLDHGADLHGPPAIQGGLTSWEAAARSGKPEARRLLVHNDLVPTAHLSWIAVHVAAQRGDVPTMEQELERGVDINALYSPEHMPEIRATLLQAAIKGGSVSAVQMLLDAGADLELISEDETAICTAIREGNCGMFHLLLLHGANPSPPGIRITPLAIAAVRGDLDMIRSLITAGAEVDRLSREPDPFPVEPNVIATPLFWALVVCSDDPRVSLDSEKYEILTDTSLLLLSFGADPNLGSEGQSEEITISPWSVICNLPDPLAEMLLDYGANPNLPDCSGLYPIQAAAMYGSAEIAELLIDAHADVNAPAGGQYFYTALRWAVHGQSRRRPNGMVEELVWILLDAGARIEDKGAILLDAIRSHCFNFVGKLLEDGIDANASSPALVVAAGGGHMELVKLLLDCGADINAQLDECGDMNPLKLSVDNGHFNMVKLLLDKGADINAQTPSDDGSTALELAAFNGYLDIVHLLLENDDEVDLLESRCSKAATYADRQGHYTLARILREYKPQRGENG